MKIRVLWMRPSDKLPVIVDIPALWDFAVPHWLFEVYGENIVQWMPVQEPLTPKSA